MKTTPPPSTCEGGAKICPSGEATGRFARAKSRRMRRNEALTIFLRANKVDALLMSLFLGSVFLRAVNVLTRGVTEIAHGGQPKTTGEDRGKAADAA